MLPHIIGTFKKKLWFMLLSMRRNTKVGIVPLSCFIQKQVVRWTHELYLSTFVTISVISRRVSPLSNKLRKQARKMFFGVARLKLVRKNNFPWVPSIKSWLTSSTPILKKQSTSPNPIKLTYLTWTNPRQGPCSSSSTLSKSPKTLKTLRRSK